MTQMTARVPTTPETHERLKEAKDKQDATTFDELLRALLEEQPN